EPVPVEDVVPEDQRDPVGAHEAPADDEGLRKALRAWLLRVAEPEAPLLAASEQLAEARQILGRGDDQDLPDAREHQHAQRVIDHRLVVDRQQLLAHHAGEWIEPGFPAAGGGDALHVRPPASARNCSSEARSPSGRAFSVPRALPTRSPLRGGRGLAMPASASLMGTSSRRSRPNTSTRASPNSMRLTTSAPAMFQMPSSPRSPPPVTSWA